MNIRVTGDLRTVADSAWISTLNEIKAMERSDEDARRVVGFLVDNNHTSPFESVSLSIDFMEQEYSEVIEHYISDKFIRSKKRSLSNSTLVADLLNFTKVTLHYDLWEHEPWQLLARELPELAELCSKFQALGDKKLTPSVDSLLGAHSMRVDLVNLHDEGDLELSRATWRVACPLSIAVQLLRHRSGCLSGDTELYFDLPTAKNNGKRRLFKKSIKDTYDLWNRGISQTKKRSRKNTYIELIDENNMYTPKQLSEIVLRSPEQIRGLCQKNRLKHFKTKNGKNSILIKGCDWISYINEPINISINIKDRIKKQNLRMCNEETGEIEHTKIKDIWESGIKDVYRLTLKNGYSIKMTSEHRCLTKKGWKTMGEAVSLTHTDKSITWKPCEFSINGIPAYQNKEWLCQKRQEGLRVKDIAEQAGVSYHTIRKYLKIYNLQYTTLEVSKLSGETQRGTKRNIINKHRWSDEDKKRIGEQHRGEKSHFWKGGVSSERSKIASWTTNKAKEVHKKYDFKCQICSSNKSLHAHHVDPVWNNLEKAYDINNLITLCNVCHDYIHHNNLELKLLLYIQNNQNLVSFFTDLGCENKVNEAKIKKYSNKSSLKLIRSYSLVENIEYLGQEMTYDLEVVGPYHNFVANGFVVHNSFNMASGRYRTLRQDMLLPPNDCLEIFGKVGIDLKDYLEMVEPTNKRYLAGMKQARQAKEQGKINNNEYKRFREFARFILPEGRMTELYATFYLNDFYDSYLYLRDSEHAQVEHIWIAQEMQKVLEAERGRNGI